MQNRNIIKKLESDFEFFIQKFFDKNFSIVFYREVIPALLQPQYNNFLKTRNSGFTELINLFALWKHIFHPRCSVAVYNCIPNIQFYMVNWFETNKSRILRECLKLDKFFRCTNNKVVFISNDTNIYGQTFDLLVCHDYTELSIVNIKNFIDRILLTRSEKIVLESTINFDVIDKNLNEKIYSDVCKKLCENFDTKFYPWYTNDFFNEENYFEITKYLDKKVMKQYF